MKLRKQDHDEIKAYLVNYINDLWNRDKDFVEVYGKDYPKKQLERNLREFKFNKSTPLQIGGEYDLTSRNIYLYNSKNPIRTLHNLIRNPMAEELMLILIHELVHAIFARNLDTEPDLNKHMTGLELYDEVQGKVINSALNEGYTEYLTNRLAKKGKVSYSQYVRIFYLLEKKLGRKGVIALGKGDVLQNLSKALNMTPDEFMEFSRKSERKFISERKLEVLKSEYEKFCEQYPEGSLDTEEAKKAIIKFDKSVHKSLYKLSIMDILPLEQADDITLEDFHSFMRYKIRVIRKQNRTFHDELYNTVRKACTTQKQSLASTIRKKVFGFIRIYDPDKRAGELRLEFYEKQLVGEDKRDNNTESDKHMPNIVSRHEAFVAEVKSRAFQTEKEKKGKEQTNIKTPKIYNDIDLQ